MTKKFYKDGIKALLIIFLLTSITFNLPVISFLAYIILPIPIIYIILKHGMKEAMVTIALAAIINGLAMGTTVGLYTVIGFGLIGFIIGGSIKENFSPRITLILTILAALGSNLLIVGIFPHFLNFDYNDLFTKMIENVEQIPELVNFKTLFEQQLKIISQIFPAILVIISIITGSLIYYASLKYLNRREIKRKVFKSIKYWQFPRWWLSIGIVITLIFRNNVYFLNLNIILLFLAFLQGFGVGLYHLTKSKYNQIYSFLYVIIVVLFSFISFIFLSLLGLIDMWFNLRKLKDI